MSEICTLFQPLHTTYFLICHLKTKSVILIKHLKTAAAKILLSSVYAIGTAYFDECVLLYVITGRLGIFHKGLSFFWGFLTAIFRHYFKKVF